jgi:hypothetical protein
MKKENKSVIIWLSGCVLLFFNGNRRRNYKIDQFGLSMTDWHLVTTLFRLYQKLARSI